jgi:DNA-binding IclR family transcriptional regulator
VERDGTGKYNLTLKLFIMGNTVPRNYNFVEIAKPYLSRLSELSGETVNLAVEYNCSVVYIDKVLSKNSLLVDHSTGETDPLYCSALGKVLLSGKGERELNDFLNSIEIVPYTKHTITSKKELILEIESVQHNSFALDIKEFGENIHCIAVPIKNSSSKIIAAISISGPSSRLTKKRMTGLRKPLMDCAGEISEKIRYFNF